MAGVARPAAGGQLTISLLNVTTNQPAWQVLIANFERVYPNITVEASYAPLTTVQQIEPAELQAGSGPDVLATFPGCGTPISVCALSGAGDLAPIVGAPWTKRSVPLVTSLSKAGETLYAFEPAVSPDGVFTNDALFARLGLKVPQTFAQLLDVCRKAKADGTVALLLAGGSGPAVQVVLIGLVTATLYGQNAHWSKERRAGSVTFDSSAGWRTALKDFVDMSNAGCFEPGATGETSTAVDSDFAQGGALMEPNISSHAGVITAANPQLRFSFSPFPSGTSPGQTRTFIQMGAALSVNAYSSLAAQAAARTFIDFIARPKQNALYAQILGNLTQYEFLKQQVPSFMPTLGPILENRQYVVNPSQTWWNASVALALQTDAIGLLTGQTTIDDVLNAMDAAWKQGPS